MVSSMHLTPVRGARAGGGGGSGHRHGGSGGGGFTFPIIQAPNQHQKQKRGLHQTPTRGAGVVAGGVTAAAAPGHGAAANALNAVMNPNPGGGQPNAQHHANNFQLQQTPPQNQNQVVNPHPMQRHGPQNLPPITCQTMRKGTVIASRYVVAERLGAGSFGVIYAGEDNHSNRGAGASDQAKKDSDSSDLDTGAGKDSTRKREEVPKEPSSSSTIQGQGQCSTLDLGHLQRAGSTTDGKSAAGAGAGGRQSGGKARPSGSSAFQTCDGTSSSARDSGPAGGIAPSTSLNVQGATQQTTASGNNTGNDANSTTTSKSLNQSKGDRNRGTNQSSNIQKPKPKPLLKVAIKFEDRRCAAPQLMHEAKVVKLLVKAAAKETAAHKCFRERSLWLRARGMARYFGTGSSGSAPAADAQGPKFDAESWSLFQSSDQFRGLREQLREEESVFNAPGDSARANQALSRFFSENPIGCAVVASAGGGGGPGGAGVSPHSHSHSHASLQPADWPLSFEERVFERRSRTGCGVPALYWYGISTGGTAVGAVQAQQQAQAQAGVQQGGGPAPGNAAANNGNDGHGFLQIQNQHGNGNGNGRQMHTTPNSKPRQDIRCPKVFTTPQKKTRHGGVFNNHTPGSAGNLGGTLQNMPGTLRKNGGLGSGMKPVTSGGHLASSMPMPKVVPHPHSPEPAREMHVQQMQHQPPQMQQMQGPPPPMNQPPAMHTGPQQPVPAVQTTGNGNTGNNGGKSVPPGYREFNVMVMQRLGNSLEALHSKAPNRKFSLNTVLLVADQLLSNIEFIHGNGYLHRDLKPENFLVGVDNSHSAEGSGCETGLALGSNVVYMIDYGLAKRYRDAKTSEHIPYREGKPLTGTARYASVATHLGSEQGRRDDLESLIYMLLYFYKGRLPWQGIGVGIGNVGNKRECDSTDSFLDGPRAQGAHNACFSGTGTGTKLRLTSGGSWNANGVVLSGAGAAAGAAEPNPLPNLLTTAEPSCQ